MDLESFLSANSEAMPDWLSKHKIGDIPKMREFLKSRVVFYPGSGSDGQPIELMGSTRFSHSFIYVDYGRDRQSIVRSLEYRDYWLKGYALFDRFDFPERELTPFGWTSHLNIQEIDPESDRFAVGEPFGFMQLLVREKDFEESHGPERLAILFLHADGVETYDAIFCQTGATPPFAMVIQDHGMGGQYTPFGESGLLKLLATNADRLPEYLLIASNTEAWSGYTKIEGLDLVYGGQNMDDVNSGFGGDYSTDYWNGRPLHERWMYKRDAVISG